MGLCHTKDYFWTKKSRLCWSLPFPADNAIKWAFCLSHCRLADENVGFSWCIFEFLRSCISHQELYFSQYLYFLRSHQWVSFKKKERKELLLGKKKKVMYNSWIGQSCLSIAQMKLPAQGCKCHPLCGSLRHVWVSSGQCEEKVPGGSKNVSRKREEMRLK